MSLDRQAMEFAISNYRDNLRKLGQREAAFGPRSGAVARAYRKVTHLLGAHPVRRGDPLLDISPAPMASGQPAR